MPCDFLTLCLGTESHAAARLRAGCRVILPPSPTWGIWASERERRRQNRMTLCDWWFLSVKLLTEQHEHFSQRRSTLPYHTRALRLSLPVCFSPSLLFVFTKALLKSFSLLPLTASRLCWHTTPAGRERGRRQRKH